MSSFIFLLCKRLHRFRFPYLLAAFLVAAVLTAALLYQGYVNALSSQFRGRLTHPTIPGAIMARQLPGVQPPVVVNAQPLLKLHIWDINTRHGNLQIAGVASTTLADWPLPQPGEVWLPESLKGQVFDEEVGDTIALTHLGNQGRSTATARVAGYYADGGFLNPLLVSQAWVASWLDEEAGSIILAYPEAALNELRRWEGNNEKAELIRQNDVVQNATNLVGSIYAGGQGAILLGVVFLALGLGTLAMLVFLDSRGEFAVLKALGLRPRTVGRLLWAEFAVTVAVGLGIGWVILLLTARQVGFPLAIDTHLFRYGLLLVAIAYLVALVAPARLARVALVNELMLGRPILLWKQIIGKPVERHPAFHDLLEQGLTCLKLERDGQSFRGAILQAVGARVKQGEPLAFLPVWFGMGEKHYVAPHDGILRVVDPGRGVIGIAPIQKGGEKNEQGNTENRKSI